jgi:hypothetical protein
LVHGLIELGAREFDQLSSLLGFVGDKLPNWAGARLGWSDREKSFPTLQ